jgi:hypothetical protein
MISSGRHIGQLRLVESRMKELSRVMVEFYEKQTIIICILVALLVLGVDYGTGKFVAFPILYALPVGMAAWKLKRNTAFLLAISLSIVRVEFVYLWKFTESIPYAVINAIIRILALLLYSHLIYKVASQRIALEKKVNILEGILPICSYCKKIRNEKGEYEQIEKYVSDRSEASFSHGICSDCAKKMYPDLFNE